MMLLSEIRFNNIMDMDPEYLSIKFTIADEADYRLAKQYFADYLVGRSGYKIFAGVVWGKLENQELVEWILRDGLPWNLNVQVHNHVWDRSMRGI